MSHDVFVMRFNQGEAAPFKEADLARILAPFFRNKEFPSEDIWAHFPDATSAEVFLGREDDNIVSIMITHFDEGDVGKVVLDILSQQGATMLTASGVPLVADPELIRELPVEISDQAIVANNPAEVIRVMVEY